MALSTAISIVDIIHRLESLDLANPVLNRTNAEKYLVKFLCEFMLSKLDMPNIANIVWLPGLNNLRQRLLDMDIYGQELYHVAARINHYIMMVGHTTVWPVTAPHWLGVHGTTPAGTKVSVTAPPSADIAIMERFDVIGDHNRMFESVVGQTSSRFYIPRFEYLYITPFLQAYENGLGFFILDKKAIILIPRPAIRRRREIINGQRRMVLHSLIGPAVNFAEDEASNQYWIRGVRVPQFVVEHPERITRAHIRAARGLRLRAAMIDQYGLLKYSLERGFKLVDEKKEFGVALYSRGTERVLKMINTTPEPDGTHRVTARRVPPTMRTAHQAVAWTFGFVRAEDYHPIVQS